MDEAFEPQIDAASEKADDEDNSVESEEDTVEDLVEIETRAAIDGLSNQLNGLPG